MRLVVALSFVCGLVPAAWADGVVVSLVPQDTVVTPGDAFTLRLQVTQAGPEFNAYDAIVGYDTQALTFLQQNPVSLQEGSDMKSACGQTFHLFSAQGDSLSISHSLLCGTPAIFLTGPAELYKLRFQASTEVQVTEVALRYVQFFRAGVFVDLESATNAIIHIGAATDAVPTIPTALHVSASPNPFNPHTTLTLTVPRPGQQSVRVWDARGRLVRHLQRGSFEAGRRTLPWDGRNGQGTPLASGVYFVTLDLDDHRATTRVVLTR